MKLFIGIIVVIAIVLVINIYRNKYRVNNNQSQKVNVELNQYYNLINQMSYEQLDKMHNDLLPLCNEITFVLIPHADSNGDPVYDSREVTIQKLNQKRAEILSPDKQIYGCKTYDDADKLNQAIVKRLDELDEA